MMTGTINHNQIIGPASKVHEKAMAAKMIGASTFLVPKGYSTELNYTESEFCNMWGSYEYCQSEITTHVIDIAQETGIDVYEVATIDEAMSYFFK